MDSILGGPEPDPLSQRAHFHSCKAEGIRSSIAKLTAGTYISGKIMMPSCRDPAAPFRMRGMCSAGVCGYGLVRP